MPRHYHSYPDEAGFQILHILSTAGASILAAGFFLPSVYLAWSLFYGKKAGHNPWHATGLEWTISSPPPTTNFATIPVVVNIPYDYSGYQEHSMTEPELEG